jgi:hypothetical protein
MKIESTDQDIRTLLSSGYYKIPRFQRPYSWDRENIQEFWDDIIRDNPVDYFVGSMVVFKVGNQRFGLVDGQQRLTTITILLCVLRNTLDQLGFTDFARGIHGLIERRNIDNQPEYILTTESSYPFFQDYIQKWGDPEIPITPLKEELNLQAAYDQLKTLVDGIVTGSQSDTTLSDERKQAAIKNKLITVRDSLLDLKLIFIKLEVEDDAYIIFETLNTRGKDLSLTDLVKNHLTKHLKAKSASIDQTKEKWEQVLETIQGSSVDLDTDTFLHHFWLSKYDYLPAKRLFKVLKKQVKKTEAKGFLNALVSDSVLYRSIHEIPYGKWTKEERRIQEALASLMLFRVRQQTPCVLSLVREYKANKIRKKHLEDALVAIERFHFLFTAVTSQRSSGGISAMYAALGRRLSEVGDTEAAVEVIRDLKEKLRERIPSREEVKALFPEIIYTENFTKQRSLMKYILTGLAKATTSAVSVDYDSMTIEHLVPQSIIGIDSWTDTIVGQAGNLILVTEDLNSKLKDKPFTEKKKILLSHNFDLPLDILNGADWTPGNIIKRTIDMAELAYQSVWKI